MSFLRLYLIFLRSHLLWPLMLISYGAWEEEEEPKFCRSEMRVFMKRVRMTMPCVPQPQVVITRPSTQVMQQWSSVKNVW